MAAEGSRHPEHAATGGRSATELPDDARGRAGQHVTGGQLHAGASHSQASRQAEADQL